MSTLNERTPLLPNHVENDSSRARAISRREGEDTSIASRARSVLHSLRLHPDEDLSLDPEPSVLVILLQASQSLDQCMEETTANVEERSIFTAVLREDLKLKIGTRLDDEVKRILGIWERDGADDQLLYEALWKRWDIDDGSRTSALEMMISTWAKGGRGEPQFLSYPIVIHFIDHLHENGPCSIINRDSYGVFTKLEAAITPKRAHFLHFISFLILWVVTIITALSPRSWIHQSTQTQKAVPSAVEVLWIIFTSGAIIQQFQNPPRLAKSLALIPSLLAVATSWTSYGITFLQFSIPCLTLSLLSPSPPSIPFLIAALLPQSIILWNRIKAGFKGWSLIWPLILVVCVVFSISLNGDVFRGFFVVTNLDSEGPVEDGVSPYGTRVAIFGTLLLLLYLAISQSISNMTRINRSPESRQMGEHRPRDRWEREYGSDIASQARAEMILGTRWLVGDLGQMDQGSDQGIEGGRDRDHSGMRGKAPPIPIPLNIILVPIDLLGLVVMLFTRGKEGALCRNVHRIGYFLTISVVGIPCWVLSLVL